MAGQYPLRLGRNLDWVALCAGRPTDYARAIRDQTELLSEVPLFARVPKKELRGLARATHDMTYEAGTESTANHA